MKSISEILNIIDSINVDSDIQMLELKISKIDSLLDYITSSEEISDSDINDALNRVSWLSIEIGNVKSFESSGKEKQLILKSLTIARNFYSNDKTKLSKFLNLTLLHLNPRDKMYSEIENELRKT